MRDFLGQELVIGDIVAVTPKNYRGLVRAKIIKFTDKQVRVEYPTRNGIENYLIYPNCIIKIA